MEKITNLDLNFTDKEAAVNPQQQPLILTLLTTSLNYVKKMDQTQGVLHSLETGADKVGLYSNAKKTEF